MAVLVPPPGDHVSGGHAAGEGAPSSPTDLGRALAEVLAPVFGAGFEIHGLARMPGGSSRETWSFTARSASGASRRLVLRRDPPGAPSSGLAMEASLLKAARTASVPVPVLVAAGDASGPLGSAFVVVEHVEGETLPRRILRDVEAAGTGPALTAQCGRVLAAIHAIPPAAVPGLPGGDPLEQLRGLVDVLRQPHPTFELALRWLAGTRPPRSADALVHGDFRNGNLVVGPEGIRAVLDWELAHRGDPV